ncbi:MAG: hypothetical protein KDB61_16785, partial [Planctomycetes bacterium]|nr:hypothetical protein [Planctomycetota bacterium]
SEVETMLHEGYANAQADFDHRRAVELITEMGTMLKAIDKNLEAAKPQLDPETLDDLTKAQAAAQTAITTGPTAAAKDALQITRDKLEQAALPLAAVLMDNVVKKAVSGKDLGDL